MNYQARTPSNPAQILARLAAQRHWTQSKIVELSAQFGAEDALSKDLFALARRNGATLSLRHHDRLARVFNLTADASYRIFGRYLDDIARLEEELNPNRTRPIESYVYHRDRGLKVPHTWSLDVPQDRSYFLNDVITSWQYLPVRSLGNGYSPSDSGSPVYAKLGLSDETASTTIPRGAYVQGLPLDEQEKLQPHPSRYYLLQHSYGYLCSRCVVEGDYLHLLVDGAGYQGSRRLRLGHQVLILARAGAYFASELLPPAIYSVSLAQPGASPVVAPWGQSSLQRLIATERRRFGLSAADIDHTSERLPGWAADYKVSGKHVPIIENSDGLPRVSTAFCLAAICSLRMQDVFRSCELAVNDTTRLSLESLLPAINEQDVARLIEVLALEEQTQLVTWPPMLKRWNDPGTLLALIRRHFPEGEFELLYLDQSSLYRGIDPRFGRGSILIVQPFSGKHRGPAVLGSPYERRGRRLVYVVCHRDRVICSYIETTGNDHLVLVPHPLAKDASPMVLSRRETTLLGTVAGALVLL